MADKIEKKKNKIFKILKISFNVVFYLFIVLLLLFSISNISVKSNEDIPNVFGKGYLSVVSESMTGNNPDSFNKGDLLIVKTLNSNKAKASLKVGDVVTYFDKQLDGFNSHRIVKVLGNGDATTYITQGDRAVGIGKIYDTSDNADNTSILAYYETVYLAQVKAVVTSHVSGAGKTLDYISNPKGGFILVIVLPTVIFLIVEVTLLIKNLLKYNNEKLVLKTESDKEEMKKQLESDRELLRQQLLEELRKEQKENK